MFFCAVCVYFHFELFDLLHCILYLDILFLYEHIKINLKHCGCFIYCLWLLTELTHVE
ncbi:hypothetical protein ACRRTK_024130 [Alexandromys fortis]